MALSKLTTELNTISALETVIRDQATSVKAAFDNDVNVVKDYINETLIPEVDEIYETKENITTNRKLSEEGDFTGTWNGHEMVESDPGIQAIVNEHTSQLADITTMTDKFDQGVAIIPPYNSTPTDAKVVQFIHGDNITPTTDGAHPSIFIQRVDQSVTEDDSGHLIPALYTVFHRKAGGKGWIYGNLAYVQDDSDTGLAQSVAVAGMIYATNNAKVWGVYGDAYSTNHLATITGAEFDAQNYSGEDYVYNDANPLEGPFSCGVWVAGAGTKGNSFGIGIGSIGNGNFDVGLLITAVDKYGIDIWNRPEKGIHFKNGATDIGIDMGESATYGRAGIHLWGSKLMFGSSCYMMFNSPYIEFGYMDGATAVVKARLDVTNTAGFVYS